MGQTYHPTGNSFENITSSNYEIEAYELDLPEVVAAKRKLLSLRLFRRRPWLLRKSRGGGGGGIVMEDEVYPKLIEANFNDLNGTRNVLKGILLSKWQVVRMDPNSVHLSYRPKKPVRTPIWSSDMNIPKNRPNQEGSNCQKGPNRQ